MSVTVVLDGAGLHAWAQRVPPRDVLAVMEVLRRRGAGRVLVPSVVTVEALTGAARDAAVNQIIKQVDVDEDLPLTRTRAAAKLRRETAGSTVDAVVAEAAVRTRAAYLITSDPDDMAALLNRGGGHAHVVTV
ncbi:MAG: twitching motility protein PilT [Egibacteraceae bacterium]